MLNNKAKERLKEYAMKKGFTMVELLVVIAVISILAALILPTLGSITEKAKQIQCKTNMDNIGKGMLLYKVDYGKNVRFPDENGGKFIAVLYTTKLVVEPKIYICPSTTDEFDKTGMANGNPAADGMSYAGRKNKPQTKYPGIYKSYQSTTATTLASDDWEAFANHENGQYINFLFVDGHRDHKRDNKLDADNYAEFCKEKHDCLADPLTN